MAIRSRRNAVLVTALLALGVAFAAWPAAAAVIHTVAGTGQVGDGPDGAYATATPLDNPQGVAVAPDGTIYIADSYNHVVREVSPMGTVSTIAEFSVPLDVAVAPDGSVYAAGFSNVYRISPEGTTTALLATGYGDTGDGGLAINATAKAPTGVAVDSQGNVYFSDRSTHKVRRIDPAGIITTVAGTGVPGNSGDNGLAVNAALNAPYDVAVRSDGRLYIADTGNQRLRIVEPDGRIWTTLATSSGVWFVEIGPDGGVYYGSRSRGQVRQLSFGLDVVAGQIFTGYAGDGGDALDARLWQPRRLAFDRAGNMYVAEEGNHVIRKVVLGSQTTRRADFDGDAWSDILWRNSSTEEVHAWLTGDVSSPYDIAEMPDVSWRAVATGDFDADGTTDIFWRHQADGRNMIWPAGKIANNYPVTRLVDPAWKVAGTGDFNNDDEADLLWRNEDTGAGFIWYSANSGTGHAIATISDPDWKMVAIADFNGDGSSDLLWRNYGYGFNRIWLGGNYQTIRPIFGLRDLAWDIAGVGDFDGDGLSDIVWRNGATGGTIVWNAADTWRSWSAGGVPLSMHLAAVADYDGDRKSDLFWRDPVSGINRVWLQGKASIPLVIAAVPGTEWEVVP